MSKEQHIFHQDGKNLYLCTYEFISGAYAQIGYKLFFAKDEEHLTQLINNYFMSYYEAKDGTYKDGETYYYFDGEIGVKHISYVEITNCKQLIEKLL